MSNTKTIPQKALMVVIALLAVNFIVTGLRYIIDPATVASEFGMPLLDGLGRSSQIGDLSAFFMSMGIFMLLALKTGERLWFYPTTILLSLTALSRVLAWAFQDAALATTMIVAEVVISGLLLLAANKLSSAKE
jgi:hypothetical protein